MKNQKQNIKQFELSPLAKAGIIIVNMENPEVEEHDISKPHRDNHCQLMFALNGTFQLNIDFELENRVFNGKWYTVIRAWKILSGEDKIVTSLLDDLTSNEEPTEDVLPF